MPRVRLTYQRDIDREGTDVIDTTDRHAALIVSERRGVILEDADTLAAMKKTELIEKAAELGVEVDKGDTKDDLVKKIRSASR